MSRSKFKKIYSEFTPKTYDQPKIPIYLKRESEDYIRYLGIPHINDPVKEIANNLDSFGEKESKLILELIKNRGELLTYDQIADLIWGPGEFKSYWALNKLVQRIQKKIDSLNIYLQIKGVRGKGYKI